MGGNRTFAAIALAVFEGTQSGQWRFGMLHAEEKELGEKQVSLKGPKLSS